MRGTMPFTFTMVSICVNNFRAKLGRISHEIRTKFTTKTDLYVC